MPCLMAPGLECEPSVNPRLKGRCVRCGSRIVSATPTRRNLELEREITEEAGRGACSVTRLVEHAEVRALRLSGDYVDDPMLIRPGRDRLLDAREEAADARNHLVFWMQEHLGDERSQDALIALRFFALAYDWLDRLGD